MAFINNFKQTVRPDTVKNGMVECKKSKTLKYKNYDKKVEVLKVTTIIPKNGKTTKINQK